MPNKKFILSTIMIAMCFTSPVSFIAHGATQNIDNKEIYQEKGQYTMNHISLHNTDTSSQNYTLRNNSSANTDREYTAFLQDNPEIKKEIDSNKEKGLILEDIAFTTVYLKEVSDQSNNYHYEPMTIDEYNKTKLLRSQSTSYHNLTISLQYYRDSWNAGKATVNQQAVWKTGSSDSYGPVASNDDFIALTVAKNYSITSHGMYGVATGVAQKSSSDNGVAYRFREHGGSQTLTTNTSYTSYSGQRLFVGSYIHTWSNIDISFSFGWTGPAFSISGSNKNWDIACDLRKTSD